MKLFNSPMTLGFCLFRSCLMLIIKLNAILRTNIKSLWNDIFYPINRWLKTCALFNCDQSNDSLNSLRKAAILRHSMANSFVKPKSLSKYINYNYPFYSFAYLFILINASFLWVPQYFSVTLCRHIMLSICSGPWIHLIVSWLVYPFFWSYQSLPDIWVLWAPISCPEQSRHLCLLSEWISGEPNLCCLLQHLAHMPLFATNKQQHWKHESALKRLCCIQWWCYKNGIALNFRGQLTFSLVKSLSVS